jgi:mitochondrial fission protein ELM1
MSLTSDAKSLHVWVLSDGRPGHYNSSIGVLRALESDYNVSSAWLDIKLRAGIFRRPLHWLISLIKGKWPLWLITLFYRMPVLPEQRPDLIISAGGKTSYLNIIMARIYQARNIFLGSLRELSAADFTTIITIEPIDGASNNIVVELAPSNIDPDQVREEGQNYRNTHKLDDRNVWAMIIGGNGGGYTYQSSDWSRLVDNMKHLAEQNHIKWLVTTSGRTGKQVETYLINNLPSGILEDAVWYSIKPKKIMQAFLGASEQVFCTEDSMTMLTESIYSNKPVFSIFPVKANPNERYYNQLARLESKHRMNRVAIEEMREIDFVQLSTTQRTVGREMVEYLKSQLNLFLE